MITHEMSPVDNERRHLDDVFRPHPVHYIMGRSTKAEPVCKPEHCLYWTWKVEPLEHLVQRSLDNLHVILLYLFAWTSM